MAHYSRMTGGCTTRVAAQMVSNVFPPITASSYILDNACGPGIISSEIKSRHPEVRILAADLSPAMVDQVRERVEREGWDYVKTETMDIRSLIALADNEISHVFMNFGGPVPNDRDGFLNAMKESFRVLSRGGVAVVSTWADRVWPTAFLKTARAVRPNEEPKNGVELSQDLLRGSWLMTQLEEAGFGNNVEVRPAVTYTSANSLDELTENMMLAQGMFFTGFDESELEKARLVLREQLRKARTYEETDCDVRIRMKAWIGMAWKTGDEGEVPM